MTAAMQEVELVPTWLALLGVAALMMLLWALNHGSGR